MATAREHHLLGVLRAGGRRDDRLAHVEVLAPRTARTAPWPAWAHPTIVEGYRALGIEQPWRHQAEAANAAHSGQHTVIATSTASGKSLAFWLPGLSAIASQRGEARISDHTRKASVLYLSPTKALAADQLASLRRLLSAAQLPVMAETCDGDTPIDARRYIQAQAQIVLTNPDMLHFSILPGHEYWARFFRGLRYVIVDECHAYRGVFGAHTALVLRRLARIATHYGAAPTFILASATTGDPAASASRLIGQAGQLACIDEDCSPAGRRTVALWRPPEIEPPEPAPPHQASTTDDDAWSFPPAPEPSFAAAALAAGMVLPEDLHRAGPVAQAEVDAADDVTGVPIEAPRRSAAAECADLLADLVVAGGRTIAFVRSRFAAESVAEQARQGVAAVGCGITSRVASYRGGYLPEERRKLEEDLRSGRILGLVSTNALELGIDISGLDAVLMAGWPGTRCSFWQQAGRAGRAGSDGLAVWVSSANPLDSYILENPEVVFGTPVEETVFDPENRYVLAPHLCAAAAELPLTDDDERYFGSTMADVAGELAVGGLLRRRPAGWYWQPASPASQLTDLRGVGSGQVSIVERETGTVLGTVDTQRAESSAHPGAVYVHQGVSFVVEELDLETRVALVEAKSPGFRTTANASTSVTIVDELQRDSWGSGIEWGFGEVEVTSQVISYTQLCLPGLDRMGTFPLDMPEHTMRTAACWYHLPAELLAAAGIDTSRAPGSLHAAEHAAIGILPLLATCDRWDLGGLSTAMHPDTGRPTVFVHDALPGGTGFAKRGFAARLAWIKATADAIASCRCAAGCPACVQSPKCGNANHPLDKAGALTLLRLLLAAAPEPPEAS